MQNGRNNGSCISGKGRAPDCEVILEAKADIPLRDLIDASKFEVEDSNLHLNIDTPDDVEQLLKVVDSL